MNIWLDLVRFQWMFFDAKTQCCRPRAKAFYARCPGSDHLRYAKEKTGIGESDTVTEQDFDLQVTDQ